MEETYDTRLEEQKRKYDENITPWAPSTKKTIATSYSIDVFERTKELIRSAETLGELENSLVVLNVNEFRLRGRPTPEEFEVLLDDFRKWEKRIEVDIAGTKKEKKKVWEKLEETISLARERYSELTRQTGEPQ